MKKLHTWIESHILTIIACFLITSPMIDSVTNLINLNSFISVSMLIRFAFLLFCAYYFFIYCKTDRRKVSIGLLVATSIYLMLYFLHLPKDNLMYELTNTMRVFYFPLLFIFLFNIAYYKKDLIKKQDILWMLALYIGVILIAQLTNTAYPTYTVSKVGTIGWFKSANEVSAIIAICLPLVFHEVMNRKTIKSVLFLTLVIITIFIVGTKTPLLSLAICLIIYWIIILVKFIKDKNKKKLGIFLSLTILIFILLITLFPKTPIYKNTLIHSKYLHITSIKDVFKNEKIMDHFILGERGKFLDETSSLYNQATVTDKFLGLGYDVPRKMIEMDFFDILFRQGILGFLIYALDIVLLIFGVARKIDLKYLFPVIIGILVASLVGHVLTSPAVSFLMAILIIKLVEKGDKYE